MSGGLLRVIDPSNPDWQRFRWDWPQAPYVSRNVVHDLDRKCFSMQRSFISEIEAAAMIGRKYFDGNGRWIIESVKPESEDYWMVTVKRPWA